MLKKRKNYISMYMHYNVCEEKSEEKSYKTVAEDGLREYPLLLDS